MNIGFVVIGRNEGDRLRRCLESVCKPTFPTVYVDSGSTDNSVAIARSFNVDVVELDLTHPFSAARARNEGFSRLLDHYPAIGFVQFVDGDCEVIADWLPTAVAALEERPELAIVAGNLHERFPEASIYNRLGDLEWNIAGVGEVDAVGGIFMIRREAFESVGGFDLTVAAGEEPELCQRLSWRGWRILRLDRRMVLHDLAMTHFGQWWTRQVRTGYGGLDVANRFGLRVFKHITYRARFWSAWPLVAIAASLITGLVMGLMPGVIAALLVLSIWPAQFIRIALRTWRKGQPVKIAFAYAWYTMLSFWPQMIGQLKYWIDQRMRRSIRLIEYKLPSQGLDEKNSRHEDSTGPISR